MKIGTKEFDFRTSCYLMGILNVTPDSFSDGGKWNSIDAALFHTEQMIHEGAAIIDIGGESARPGHQPVSEEEEIERVLPYIEAIKQRFDIPISIDTYKAKTAKEAFLAGADLLNDIWGLKGSKEIAEIAAKFQRPCCLMHNRNREQQPYVRLMDEVLSDLRESLQIAYDAGIKKENLLLDPGIGFGKTTEENLIVLNHLERLLELDYPILLGTSRKSVIGNTLDLPTDQRVEGTIATTVMGVLKGCRIFRVHDVKENYRAMKMAEAIINHQEKDNAFS